MHSLSAVSRPRAPLAVRSDANQRASTSKGPAAPSASPVKRLLRLKTDDPDAPSTTIYTLRLSTGLARGAALNEYNAGVHVCLIGQGGDAYLHRVQPLADPQSIEQELMTACDSLDDACEAGADCRLSLRTVSQQRGRSATGSAAEGAPSSLAGRRRFQEGSVDEVCFPGPELGPLSGLLVAPEAGRWLLDEVDVSSSRTGHTDRFICRESLGDGGARPAALLAPVPQGAVVYGSGDSAVVLSKAQAAELHAFHMQQYSAMKTQLLNLTALLVGVGSGGVLALAGPTYALPFALGGSSALLYQFLLQQGIDGIGADGRALAAANPPRLQPGLDLSLKLALTNPAVRMALTAGGLLASFGVLHVMALGQDGKPDGETEFKQILVALSGFLMYKVAILIASVVPQPQSSLLAGIAKEGSED